MELSAEDARGEIEAAFIAIRAFVDDTRYGSFVSDKECRDLALAVVDAVEKYRAGEQL